MSIHNRIINELLDECAKHEKTIADYHSRLNEALQDAHTVGKAREQAVNQLATIKEQVQRIDSLNVDLTSVRAENNELRNECERRGGVVLQMEQQATLLNERLETITEYIRNYANEMKTPSARRDALLKLIGDGDGVELGAHD